MACNHNFESCDPSTLQSICALWHLRHCTTWELFSLNVPCGNDSCLERNRCAIHDHTGSPRFFWAREGCRNRSCWDLVHDLLWWKPNAGFERGNIRGVTNVQTVWRKWHAKDRPNSHLAYSAYSAFVSAPIPRSAFAAFHCLSLWLAVSYRTTS